MAACKPLLHPWRAQRRGMNLRAAGEGADRPLALAAEPPPRRGRSGAFLPPPRPPMRISSQPCLYAACRMAAFVVGMLYPTFESFRAIESRGGGDDTQARRLFCSPLSPRVAAIARSWELCCCMPLGQRHAAH